MTVLKLKVPIEVGGVMVEELTFRRAKAKDMVIIGDHMPNLSRFENVSKEEAAKAMDGSMFAAMIAIVGCLSDIGGKAAGELDFADLVPAATEAMEGLGET